MNDTQNIQKSFDSALVDYLELSNILIDELNYLLDKNNEDDQNQYWRRSFIRAAWSLIDGYIYAMRLMCRTLTLLPLHEEVLNEKEKEFVNNDRQETANNIKGTLKIALKIFSLPLQIDFGSPQWTTLKQAIEKRHDIIHPKSAKTIFVNNDEWENQKSSLAWFINTFNVLIKTIHKQFQ